MNQAQGNLLFKHCTSCHFNVDKPISECGTCNPANDYKNWKAMTELVTNSKGAKQSKNEFLWTDFCPSALLRIAKVSNAGCQKYGENNWKKISSKDHLNHCLTHIFKYLEGDTEEDHLIHAAWRIIAAIGVAKNEKKKRK